MDQELGLLCDNSNKTASFLGKNYDTVTKSFSKKGIKQLKCTVYSNS